MIVIANSTILGENLRYLRESKQLSLEEMATLLLMDPQTLAGLEDGTWFDIDYESLKVVFSHFEGDMDHLFDKRFAEE